MRSDVGIDLGTSRVLVYIKNKGIVLNEPTVVAIDENKQQFLSVGEEARLMLGRTPGNIRAIRPLKDGVISDYDITEGMLKYFLKKSIKRSFLKPRAIICAPSGITEVEKRAVIDACNNAGAYKTYIIEEPIAAAIGAGLDITSPDGNIVIDIGAGTTDIAVISLGGLVVNESIRVGGDDYDEAIIRYIRQKHNVIIGESSAEKLKRSIGCACKLEETRYQNVKGRSLVSGLPVDLNISSDDILEALKETVNAIMKSIHTVLEKTPPELAADIGNKGIVLTGGGALLKGFDELVEKSVGIDVRIAENPIECVAMGTGKSLAWIDELELDNQNNI